MVSSLPLLLNLEIGYIENCMSIRKITFISHISLKLCPKKNLYLNYFWKLLILHRNAKSGIFNKFTSFVY